MIADTKLKPKAGKNDFTIEGMEKSNRPKNRPLRVTSFIGFSILGAGAWGWGAFATFLFAIAATVTLSNIIER